MAIIPSSVRRSAPAFARSDDYAGFQMRHPEFMIELASLRRHRDRELAKLRALGKPDLHDRVRKLLRDRRLHLLYAYEAVRKMRHLASATPASIGALAAQWNPFEVCREATNIFWVPGRTQLRRVVSFGPRRRMQQALVAALIRALHPPSGRQKLFQGGMPAALAAVEAAIKDGYDYGMEVDVIHFYASVRPTALAELLRPLPSSVVEHVVWDTGVRRDPDSDFASIVSSDDPSLNGLVGLAPGAATSPIVGERIIGQLLAACRDFRLVAYADNVFVLGRSAEEVSACFQHLRSAAERHEAGPLRLRTGGIRLLSQLLPVSGVPEPFTFLHHDGMLMPDGVKGLKVVWSPDERKLDEFRSAGSHSQISLEQIDAIEGKVSHWRRSYPTWQDGDRWEMQYLAELAARRYYQAAEPLNLSRAAHAIILYCMSGEGADPSEIAPDGFTAQERLRRQRLLAEVGRRFEVIGARH
jgi:hypothetical protein